MNDCVELRRISSERSLSISIVTYYPDREVLTSTLSSLKSAIGMLSNVTIRLYIIDNSAPGWACEWLKSLVEDFNGTLICGHGNIGFGSAHNLILDKLQGFHLYLNPDVELSPDALIKALDYMASNMECGLLTPSCYWPDGSRQYLCKRYPSIIDLVLRALPQSVGRRLYADRINRYEMRDFDMARSYINPSLTSGCFMLFRSEVLTKLGGFDPEYFLYFEDFDLCMRSHEFSTIHYVPDVKIIHKGGNTAGKGIRHIFMFVRSGRRFYSKFGWRVW